MKVGTLHLLPNGLGDRNWIEKISPDVAEAVAQLDGLIAESPQGGLSFLNRFKTKVPPHQVPIGVFNEHSRKDEIDFFLKPILEGGQWGLVSDAGLPCLADPGHDLVLRAKQMAIPVKAYTGQSSLLMTLMLSGLPAQRFSFHGYPPSKQDERIKQIEIWEKISKKDRATQMMIEAPYRNQYLLQDLIDHLNPKTYLTVAWDLTLTTERVMTYSVETWRKSPPPSLAKKPAVFAFYASEI
ncbi:MAG: SAM-dependent methyltransferase [Parachlamydiales bacterium]|nr:SAM-dependent methyltransferase [Parachlamydiales bacterium]